MNIFKGIVTIFDLLGLLPNDYLDRVGRVGHRGLMRGGTDHRLRVLEVISACGLARIHHLQPSEVALAVDRIQITAMFE